jgi:hypothetical protein
MGNFQTWSKLTADQSNYEKKKKKIGKTNILLIYQKLLHF